MTVTNAAAWPALILIAAIFLAGVGCTVWVIVSLVLDLNILPWGRNKTSRRYPPRATSYHSHGMGQLSSTELDALHRRIDRGQR